MAEPAITLDPQQRELVDDTIRCHCEIRHWSLHALNVRTNHVHVVITECAHESHVYQVETFASRGSRSHGRIDARIEAVEGIRQQRDQASAFGQQYRDGGNHG